MDEREEKWIKHNITMAEMGALIQQPYKIYTPKTQRPIIFTRLTIEDIAEAAIFERDFFAL